MKNKKDNIQTTLGKGREVKNWSEAMNWLKERIFRKIKDQVSGTRRREMVARALSFSQTNKDSLIIIGDTKRDVIIMAYNKEFMTVDISSKFWHCNQKIIRKILNKEIKNKEDAKSTAEEFIHILTTLIFNFVEIINRKKEVKPSVKTEEKVADTNPI